MNRGTEEQGKRDKEQGTRNKGQGIRNKGQGIRNKEQGTRDKGQGREEVISCKNISSLQSEEGCPSAAKDGMVRPIITFLRLMLFNFTSRITMLHTNHLIHETSPYLLQHAHNPVNWHPWDEETTRKAREEDKPTLAAIGMS